MSNISSMYNKRIKIKVYFIKLFKNKTNTASENRFWGIHEMVQQSFYTEVIYTKEVVNFNSKILRYFYNRFLLIGATIKILKKRSAKDINVLYLFSVDPVFSIYYFLFARVFRFVLISERNEFPYSIIHDKKVCSFLERHFIYPWYYKIFDGYSIISDTLINHYIKYITKRQIIHKLPMTVDFTRFNHYSIPSDKNYIFFAGSLDNRKDGVRYLISAFSEIEDNLDSVYLFIASNSNSKEFKDTEDFIHEKKAKKVCLLNNVERDIIPSYMFNSRVCVLPRPYSRQAKGGFPTKLGEYLASGKPVIVTDIGEIPNYLTNNEVYFISYNNIENQLKEKLIEIFENYEIALQKGLLGREKAKNHFDLKTNQQIIRDLVERTILKRF